MDKNRSNIEILVFVFFLENLKIKKKKHNERKQKLFFENLRNRKFIKIDKIEENDLIFLKSNLILQEI